jgi:hypothetical protein
MEQKRIPQIPLDPLPNLILLPSPPFQAPHPRPPSSSSTTPFPASPTRALSHRAQRPRAHAEPIHPTSLVLIRLCSRLPRAFDCAPATDELAQYAAARDVYKATGRVYERDDDGGEGVDAEG